MRAINGWRYYIIYLFICLAPWSRFARHRKKAVVFAPNSTYSLTLVSADERLSGLFKRDSWEEKMVSQCKSSLSVSPKRAKSVLFYSQHPDGRKDEASLHGGCPVLVEKQKWAANLWVWNAPRLGYPEAPVKLDKGNSKNKQRRKKNSSEQADPR